MPKLQIRRSLLSLLHTLGNLNIALTIRHCNFKSALVWKHWIKRSSRSLQCLNVCNSKRDCKASLTDVIINMMFYGVKNPSWTPLHNCIATCSSRIKRKELWLIGIGVGDHFSRGQENPWPCSTRGRDWTSGLEVEIEWTEEGRLQMWLQCQFNSKHFFNGVKSPSKTPLNNSIASCSSDTSRIKRKELWLMG